MKYVVVFGFIQDADRFEKDVEENLKKGYKLVGGIATMGNGDHVTGLIQAMVKEST